MKKINLAAMALTAVLSVSILSANANIKKEERGFNYHKDSIIHTIMMLDLTPEQRDDLTQIIAKHRAKRSQEMISLFGEKGFNKEKYIQMRLNKKELMLKEKADMIAEAYAILNDVQKGYFKNHMARSYENREFRGKGCDKNYNGGR